MHFQLQVHTDETRQAWIWDYVFLLMLLYSVRLIEILAIVPIIFYCHFGIHAPLHSWVSKNVPKIARWNTSCMLKTETCTTLDGNMHGPATWTTRGAWYAAETERAQAADIQTNKTASLQVGSVPQVLQCTTLQLQSTSRQTPPQPQNHTIHKV